MSVHLEKPTEYVTQWVCADCFVLLCNGDISDGVENPDALLSKFEGFRAFPGLRLEEHGDCCPYRQGDKDAECECGHDTYSTSSCDGCGDVCHGERYAVTIEKIEPPHADYPHEPGALYDCPACEAQCHCGDLGLCVHCAIEDESFAV